MPNIDFREMLDKDQPIRFSEIHAKVSGREKRAVMDCCLRLEGALAFAGLPKLFGAAYRQMADTQEVLKTTIDHKLDNMTISFFLTPDSAKAALTVQRATINSFFIERDKGKPHEQGKNRPPSAIHLWFKVSFDVKNDKQAKLFCWDQCGEMFWWTAVPGQGELEMEAGKE